MPPCQRGIYFSRAGGCHLGTPLAGDDYVEPLLARIEYVNVLSAALACFLWLVSRCAVAIGSLHHDEHSSQVRGAPSYITYLSIPVYYCSTACSIKIARMIP